jgi:site-specific DNA-methyltransferase (adenine-specific)
MIDLRLGDCLEVMKTIKSGSIDAIITDPPYGTTACKWDSVIPFDSMWEQLNRIIKPNGAIVLFGSEPFSSALRMSNIKNFKYDWIWKKNAGSNFGSVRFQPMKEHENICIFGKGKLNYYPIRQKRADSGFARQKTPIKYNTKTEVYSNTLHKEMSVKIPKDRVPSSVQKFNRERGLHPTQKPVLLMEYLIKTYTNEGETVLDFTMGSGTTMLACKNLKRKGIGIEKDETYFKIAEERINKIETQPTMFQP